MSSPIRLGATMIALLALLAACGQTTDSQSPEVTAAPTATMAPTPTLAPTATMAPTPTVTPGPPSAPTAFTATEDYTGRPCPSSVPTDDDYNLCTTTDFAWQSTEGSDVWFRIFTAATAEGGRTCGDIQASEYSQLLDTAPGARVAQYFRNGRGTGSGTLCYWLVSVNPQGSSAMVPASGQ